MDTTVQCNLYYKMRVRMEFPIFFSSFNLFIEISKFIYYMNLNNFVDFQPKKKLKTILKQIFECM